MRRRLNRRCVIEGDLDGQSAKHDRRRTHGRDPLCSIPHQPGFTVVGDVTTVRIDEDKVTQCFEQPLFWNTVVIKHAASGSSTPLPLLRINRNRFLWSNLDRLNAHADLFAVLAFTHASKIFFNASAADRWSWIDRSSTR